MKINLILLLPHVTKSYGNPPAFRTKEYVGCSLIGSQKQPSTSSNRTVAAKNEVLYTQTKLHNSYINGGTPANNRRNFAMLRGIKKMNKINKFVEVLACKEKSAHANVLKGEPKYYEHIGETDHVLENELKINSSDDGCIH